MKQTPDLSRMDAHSHLEVVLIAIAVVAIAILYFVVAAARDRMEHRLLLATFRVTVPTDTGPVVLRYCHIELLCALVRPRAESYFRRRKKEWDARLDDDLADVIAMFTRAELIRKSRSIEGSAVLSAKGAALVAEHGREPKARAAAKQRLRKRRSLERRAKKPGVA